jgi:hypothetical protein
MNQPQNLLGTPSYGSHHPQPVGPGSYGHEPRAPYVPRTEPRLTVRADGSVHLNAEAARLLPDGETIDLRPPIRERDNWHLDTRPGGHYRRLPVGNSGGVRFKAAARTNAMLGACSEVLHFTLEHVGHGLFKLYPKTGNN